MRSVIIPSPLKERLDEYLSAFVLPDIDKICLESALTNEETNLIKRYVKSYFSFKKRGNMSDLEIIERIVWNEKLMILFEDFSALYPFLMDIRQELRYINLFYSDIKGGQPWRKQNKIANVFTSPMSYSAYSILYAYVLKQKPKAEDLSIYDEYDDPNLEETKFNPVVHFYKWFRYDHESRKNKSIGREFFNFACYVIEFFWDERNCLLEMDIPNIDVKKTFEEASNWIDSLGIFGNDKKESSAVEDVKSKKKQERVSIAYDLVLAQRTANEISTLKEQLGENFAPYQVAIDQINKNYPGVFPITNSGVLDALLCLYRISDGQTDLTPIQEDEHGKTFEASIYQLYKITKGNSNPPSSEDLARFITGLEFLTYPRRFPRKVRNPKTKREEIIIKSLALLELPSGVVLPIQETKVNENNEEEKRIIDKQKLGSQKITFTLHSAFYEGIDDEVTGEDGNPLYLPIETKGKELRQFPIKALRRDTTGEYSRLLFNLSSCVQMLEENLMEAVFDYNGQIEKARKDDIDGIPCDKVETRKGREPRAFATWEEWRKRQISKKQKPKDKKKLQAYFEDAVKDGVIISYSFKNNKYAWKYKEGEEKQGL